jgi:hypothetical protein
MHLLAAAPVREIKSGASNKRGRRKQAMTGSKIKSYSCRASSDANK